MSSIFSIEEHTLECQHIREYARATSTSQEDVLHLAIKQYTPLDNPNPRPGDVTIIGAHANGFPKEMYEPLWEDLHERAKQNGWRIRSIWIADMAGQGKSGALNEKLLGNDPSWFDHPRDLLHMINHFRASMPQPIIGIGHSLGAAILCNLSFMHPRLLTTLVLMDPVIHKYAAYDSGGPDVARLSTFRRDLWPSREAAVTSFRNQSFYKAWDPRVLDRWCEFGLRETPTTLYPDEKPGSVTLRTTKHQECFHFLRPSWEGLSASKTVVDRSKVPDLDPEGPTIYPFYRGEPNLTLEKLGELRPSALYIFGGESDMSGPASRREKIAVTGAKFNGSGGAAAGRVKERVLEGIGHLVAMDVPNLCADAAASWIGPEIARWEEGQREYEAWTQKSWVEKATLDEEWKRRIGGPLKPVKEKL